MLLPHRSRLQRHLCVSPLNTLGTVCRWFVGLAIEVEIKTAQRAALRRLQQHSAKWPPSPAGRLPGNSDGRTCSFPAEEKLSHNRCPARFYVEVNFVMDVRKSCRSPSVWEAKLSCFKRDVGSLTVKK